MLDQDQYWLGHLKAIDASGTTTKAYGKLHGYQTRATDPAVVAIFSSQAI
jgi:hypothetical protein